MDFSKLKKMLLVATVSALPMLSFAQDVEVITVEGGDGPILSRNQQEYNLTVEHALLDLCYNRALRGEMDMRISEKERLTELYYCLKAVPMELWESVRSL